MGASLVREHGWLGYCCAAGWSCDDQAVVRGVPGPRGRQLELMRFVCEGSCGEDGEASEKLHCDESNEV